MDILDGDPKAFENGLESIKLGGDIADRRRIDNQLHGRDSAADLISGQMDGNKWINYKIEPRWIKKKGGNKNCCLQYRRLDFSAIIQGGHFTRVAE